MPASGGMAGVSIAAPQDNLSAINGNPATLTQFGGTQFAFGAAWAEATYNIDQLAPLPAVGVDPYSAKSSTPGAACPNIGVTKDLSPLGLPAVWGIGLFTSAGAGTDYRSVPESAGTNGYYLALDFTTGVGIPLTDNLSAGATMTVGNSFIDGPFVDIGGMTPAYGLRGALGATYDLGMATKLGAYWQTKKHFHFEDAVEFRDGSVFDLEFDQPENVGVGIANESLMDGRLLLAMDVVFKNYSDCDFLGQIYDDQWVGVPLPDGVPALRYIQGQFAAVSQHRVTGGVGFLNVMPGMDLDFLAGGMFEGTDQFASTVASVESYWLGAYLTWRFGRCSR
jgi:long-chain fatty acid transport protein